jgi:hypothetical protein
MAARGNRHLTRHRFAAPALTEAERASYESDPERAVAHASWSGRCDPCHGAAPEQGPELAALLPSIAVALSHGHRVLVVPGVDDYSVAIRILPERERDRDYRFSGPSHETRDAMGEFMKGL